MRLVDFRVTIWQPFLLLCSALFCLQRTLYVSKDSKMFGKLKTFVGQNLYKML
ncbi:hypothetical protein HMPREF1218_2272 [Hoylesella pleuritidis F0068]|uniref:Uncharacterized protein n=1 Tax=Hoylesella pleuritidis F0068 TaxID=1081904 RepID=U2L8G8_9BACT|nr:hypothetical protein HMPREF1218_2272 [Hoylesella pleuritidis F0068]